MRRLILICMLALVGQVFAKGEGCSLEIFKNEEYSVCRFDPKSNKIELALENKGQPLSNFYSVLKMHSENSVKMILNAGMFNDSYQPIGLYIENGKQFKKINLRDGYGNFHLKPNGVFAIKNSSAQILESQKFVAKNFKPDFATQSGPLLVINNSIHPLFHRKSTSFKIRNGVGVAADGSVVFALSSQPVNFFSFAAFFRDFLKCPNALYLDGSISAMYAPSLGLEGNNFFAVGPMFVVR